jgi:hypothetical protein
MEKPVDLREARVFFCPQMNLTNNLRLTLLALLSSRAAVGV